MRQLWSSWKFSKLDPGLTGGKGVRRQRQNSEEDEARVNDQKLIGLF